MNKRTTGRNTETTTPRKSVNKPQRMKHKEQILKSARGKREILFLMINNNNN